MFEASLCSLVGKVVRNMYNPYVIGQHIYLRHPTEADVEGRWHEWLSDEKTTRWLAFRYWPNSVERQREFYKACEKSGDRLVLSIIDKETDRHIGACNLSSINWVSRYCDIAILIGEDGFRTGPYVLEGMSLMLRIAFDRLNLRIVKSSYAASNEASHKIHEIFRFKEVGRLKDLLWDSGQYIDCVITTLHRDDWAARNKLIPPNY